LNSGYLALELKFKRRVSVFFKKLGRNPYLSLGKYLLDYPFSGVPPKIKAETSTPVSTTTLFFSLLVCLSPYFFNSLLYVLDC